MTGPNDPIRTATRGLLDWDELLAVLVLIGLLVFVTGAGREQQPKCEPVIQLQAGNQRQLSPHEQQDNGPTPALAPGRWIDERYQL
ncbi:hypothetical protein CCOS865_02170 [Pseudomonas reidholzensis]|uniref:Uncharacterized protein n=1 Tax=Pseudomonas reidholzensis TaxID=1785162 RepID=A0A383RTD1_9PSED|nr:hypothetical protein [Pseudomonas reidholzensis]SYX89904.1 hypothetical protein CCOS865_02170 [Pseudomonas reidholzensis]